MNTNNFGFGSSGGSSSGSAWAINGNTVGSEKWLGTVDSFALPIRVGNIEVARFLTNQKFQVQNSSGDMFLTQSAGTKGIFIGYLAGVTSGTVGTGAIEIGERSSGTIAALNIGTNSCSMGLDARATSTSSTAIGNVALATAVSAIAIGYAALAEGIDNISLGTSAGSNGASPTGSQAVSIGYFANTTGAVGVRGLAIGYLCNSRLADSTAVGNSVLANGVESTGVGCVITTSATYASAFGNYLTASATGATVVGFGNGGALRLTNSTAYSVALGANSDTPTMWVTGGAGTTGTYGSVGVATSSPTSRFHVNGSVAFKYVAKTATYTATIDDFTIDCTSGTFTVNLPTAVGITGRIYVIKNSGVGVITLDADGTETIDGLTTQTIISLASLTVQSNGANWIII